MENMPEIAFSQACENNKTAILSVLKLAFNNANNVLEIGSGTGQHAIFFAENLPYINWQTSDLLINHYSINKRIDDYAGNNLSRPLIVDLNQAWQLKQQPDAIFTANTLHIVSWPLVQSFFINAAMNISKNGKLCIYGPLNYEGKYTSESNANFDLWLKARSVDSGIRDFEAIEQLALAAGFSFLADNEMPANNRLLVFSKN